MRRHPSIAPLSRDHHRALAEAARARRAAGAGPDERRDAAGRFAAFFAAHAVPHVRAEEEDLFPLVVPGDPDAAPEPLVRALVQHARLHRLAGEVAAAARAGDVPAEALAAAGALLEEHVRLEERVLFPLIEERADPALLRALRLPAARPTRGEAACVADLRAPEGRGVAWSATSADLNVNAVTWPPGGGVDAHVNAERDVLWLVLEGGGEVSIDGEAHPVEAGWAALVPAGADRAVRAGPRGIRYVSTHLRRPPGISPA